jgi:RNA polymerase sigma factor (sigma-70 family)
MSCVRSLSPGACAEGALARGSRGNAVCSPGRVHALLKTQFPYLLARARRMTRDEADARDLVQDTIVLALEYFRRGGEYPTSVTVWFFVVMRNRWFTLLRRERVRATIEAAVAHCSANDTSLLDTRATRAQLRKAWEELPPRGRRVAEQCLLEEDSYETVSERLGTTTTNVALSIFRTRDRLGTTMFEEGREGVRRTRVK